MVEAVSHRWHALFEFLVILSRAAQSSCRCQRCELLRGLHQRVIKQVRAWVGKPPRHLTFVPFEPASEFFELATRAGVDDALMYSLIHLQRETTAPPEDFSLWGLLLVDPEGATAYFRRRCLTPRDKDLPPPSSSGKRWQGLLELWASMERAQASKCLCDRCTFFRDVYKRCLHQLRRWGNERRDVEGFLRETEDTEFLFAAKDSRVVGAKWLEAARRAGGPQAEAVLLAGLLVDPQGAREQWNQWLEEAAALRQRAALSPESEQAVREVIRDLRQALEEFAEHGCRIDVHPALRTARGETLCWDVVDWCAYILTAHENVRSVAKAALQYKTSLPPFEGEEDRHPLWREIGQLEGVLRQYADDGAKGLPLSDEKGCDWRHTLMELDRHVRDRASTALRESLRRLGP